MPQHDKCMICQQLITENLVRCPYCASAAHKEELQRWVLRYKTCPRCGRDLKAYAS